MKLNLILYFIIFWGVTNRLSEIAVFPGWISRLGPWFDTFYTPNEPTWYPFRDAYHTFKALPVLAFCIFVGLSHEWYDGFFIYGAWALGQWLGTWFKK